MIVTAFRELITRRVSTALGAIGLLTATVGFMLLAGTSQTTAAALQGSLSAAWSSPYDILVRPPGVALSLEQAESLVRPNFLSASPSGINLKELDTIRAIPGVDVAAPIAIVGVTQLGLFSTSASVPVDLSADLEEAPVAAFRLEPSIVADGGYSRFDIQPITVVVAIGGTHDFGNNTLTIGGRAISCAKVICFGGKATCPQPDGCAPMMVGDQQRVVGLDPGRPGASIYFPVPVTIAGVDPVAEEQLSGVGHCVTSGHYLQSGSGEPLSGDPVPILLADRTLLDEAISVTVSRTSATAQLIAGQDPAALSGWQQIGVQKVDPNVALRGFEEGIAAQFPNLSPIWLPGPVQYDSTAGVPLVPITQTPDPKAYLNPSVQGVSPVLDAPPEASDLWFRKLQEHAPSFSEGLGNQWNLVGRFDPTCVPGFDSTGSGQLGTFVAPTLTTPDGRTIGPNRSIAGYLDSPPLMLTTLEGAQYFADPKHFAGGPGPNFISAIRVRVSGTAQLGKAAEERLARVAAQIRDATGLQVDIVKGSSPRPLRVDLPAGSYGRPALTVTENWAAKGIAFRFLQAVSLQNLGVFASVLLAAIILVAQTAYVSVRRRRRELAVLRAIGWPPWRIALLIEMEMGLVGLGVGLIGLVVGVPMALAAHLGPTWWTVIGVVPLSVLIALIAAAVPATMASRGPVLDGISEPEPIRERVLPSSPLALGFRQILVWRWDVASGVSALALGGALFGLAVLIAAAFRGQLDTTLLGTYVSGQVRPFHFVLAGLTMGVGAIAATEVVTLAYLDRTAHLATLRALGWPRAEVVKLLAGEALGMGVIGATIAGAVPLAASRVLSASFGATLAAVLAALAGTGIAMGLAVLGPLVHAYSSNPVDSLRGE